MAAVDRDEWWGRRRGLGVRSSVPLRFGKTTTVGSFFANRACVAAFALPAVGGEADALSLPWVARETGHWQSRWPIYK
jgi:hypothetical protein